MTVEFFVKEKETTVGRVEIGTDIFDVVPMALVNTAFGATIVKLINTNTGEEFLVEEMGGRVNGKEVQADFDDEEFEETGNIVLCITILEK